MFSSDFFLFLGILAFINIAALGFYLYLQKSADKWGLAIILSFAVVSLLAFPNVGKRLAVGVSPTGIELRTLRDETVGAAESAKETKQNIETLREQINSLTQIAQSASERAADAAQVSERARESVVGIEQRLSISSQAFLRSFYLSLKTRNVFPIPQAVAQQIERDLNTIAVLAYPSAQERERKMQEINELLQRARPR